MDEFTTETMNTKMHRCGWTREKDGNKRGREKERKKNKKDEIDETRKRKRERDRKQGRTKETTTAGKNRTKHDDIDDNMTTNTTVRFPTDRVQRVITKCR